MKKILGFFLVAAMLVTLSATVFTPYAATTAPTSVANYYEWNFDDSALNDLQNGVFTANSGNNTITVKTPSDLTVANTVNSYLTNKKYTAGYSVSAAKQSNGTKVYTEQGDALYVCDRYLEFGTSVHLDCDKAWKIELVGNLPKGGINNSGSNGIGKTALFANESGKDYIFVDGGNRAFWLYDNNYSFSVQTENSTGVWSSGARIGQQRDQKLIIQNVQQADGTWRISWSIAECYNSTDAWTGGWTTWNSDTTKRDFVFSGIGSNAYYITANPSGTNGYNPFFSSIKIWEDTSVVMDGFQLKNDVTASSASAPVRVLTTIKGLDWQEAGYLMSISNAQPELGGNNVTKYTTKTVYSSVGAGDDVLRAEEGSYYVGIVIDNIPNASFGTEIYVRPYAVDANGGIVYGNVMSFSVSELLALQS